MQILQQHDLEAFVHSQPGFAGAKLRPAPSAIASPSYRSLDSQSCFVEGDSKQYFLKRMYPEMMGFYDIEAAFQGASAAGRACIGPRVLWADAQQGAICLEALGDSWRGATMADLQDRDFVASVTSQMKAFHSLELELPHYNPFGKLESLQALAHAHAVELPADMGWINALLSLAQTVLERAPLVPCRNDGSASNLMRHETGQAMLVDFDRAGMNDAMYDLGVLLIEVTDFESDMVPAFLAYHGRWDEAAFARARLWAVVDDILHMLQARICGKLSHRQHLEWLKYGEWRLMRARMALHHPQFEEKIRVAAGGEQ